MRALAVAGVAVAALALSACGEDDDALRDADKDNIQVNDQSIEVTKMPDQYPNIARVCVDGHMVFVTTREDQAPVVIEDGCRE